mgnify:CR=1 FL=1
MAKLTKNRKTVIEKLDSEKSYSLEEASTLVKEITTTKFDSSVDLAIRLGVDPRKANEMIRGVVSLPHGTGKSMKLLALVTPDKEDEAKKAGADLVGLDEYIEKIKKGWVDVDVIVTMPSVMGKLGPLGKVLGPKGLMPNPKSGTVTENIEKAIKDLKHGQVIFKAEQQGIIQGTIANSEMDDAQITENLNSFIAELKRLKPASSKGIYIKDIYLSTSMGPGYRIDVSQF